jgi:hypothetical protein
MWLPSATLYQQLVEKCRRGISELRQMGSKASHGSRNNDLRRHFAKRIRAASQPIKCFNSPGNWEWAIPQAHKKGASDAPFTHGVAGRLGAR